MTDKSSLQQFSTSSLAGPATLQVSGASKTFDGKRVLHSVDLTVNSGEVLALLGQNGSGKSTLIKVLSGFHEPDRGTEVRIDGETMRFGSPVFSHRAGLRFVHQDLALIDDATVLDNIAFDAGYATRGGTIRRRECIRQAQTALDRVGSNVNPRQLVGELSPAQKTGVAVARALAVSGSDAAKVLVLDEPTATLPGGEVDRLLSMLRASADSGVAVILVTHHLDEVFKIADRVTVLRDGNVVAASAITEIDRRSLVHKLIGAELEEAQRHALSPGDEDAHASTRLVVRDLYAQRMQGVSLEAHQGEVVGIYGLTGSGREAILGTMFGALTREKGVVRVDGTMVRADSPRASISSGIGYLPPDRKIRGGMMLLPAYENITVPRLNAFARWGTMHKKPELADARKWFAQLDVRPSDAVKAPLASFSGGNQQKILIAKWLRLSPKVLLLDEPTQGVDVGAKVAIHECILAAAKSGTAIVVSSSDEDELAAICDRVLIMRAGEIAAELSGREITVNAINASMHAVKARAGAPGVAG